MSPSLASVQLAATVPTGRDAGVFGRRSFGGFNSFAERNYANAVESDRLDSSITRGNRNTISEEEMVALYSSLIGLPRGPQQGKKPSNELHPQKCTGKRKR